MNGTAANLTRPMTRLQAFVILAVLLAGSLGCQQDPSEPNIFVGHLADYSGQTAFVGKHYGPGVSDALKYINDHGGISGTPIVFQTVDYAYDAEAAVSIYTRWVSRNGMVALQGWGTQDTEALRDLATEDKLPIWSASYSGQLTDPTGRNPGTTVPAPYNFFYGPSYSDACRALVAWAAEDAKARGVPAAKFVHVGADLPYPNAPKKACAEYAAELGFSVMEAIEAPLAAGDFTTQCETLASLEVDYVYLANLGDSIISMLGDCAKVALPAEFMTNIWGGDHEIIRESRTESLVFPAATPFWRTQSVGGMSLVRRIHANGHKAVANPTHHYIRGICSAFYMKEAMEWAKAHGGLSGDNIRQGMYARSAWVPEGLEGVCTPSTWTPDDHRGTTAVTITRGWWENGEVKIEPVETINLSRRKDWIGY